MSEEKISPKKVLAFASERALGKSGLDRAINSLTETIFHWHVTADMKDIPQDVGMNIYDDLIRSFVLIANYIANVEASVRNRR